MNGIKLLVLLSMFMLIITFSNARIQQEINFSETFGNTAFDFRVNTTNCLFLDTDNHNNLPDLRLNNYTDFEISVNFDNTWYCLFQAPQSNDEANWTNSTHTNRNTDIGFLHKTSATCSGENCQWILSYFFPFDVDFLDQTNISFGVNYENTVSTGIRLDFYTETGRHKFGLNVGDNLPGISGLNTSNICTYANDGVSFSNSSIGIENIKNNCSSIITSDLEEIRRFDISFTSGGPEDLAYIDDISFNVFNGSNRLPIFNITINETGICANSSLQNLELPIVVDSFDFEDDTILYATGTDETYTGTSFNFGSEQTDQTVVQCGDRFRFNINSINPLITFATFIGVCNLDSIPLNVPIPQFTTFSDSCKVIKAVNSTEFYIDEKLDNDDNIVNMVIYNPFCSRHKESYVDLDDVFRDFFFNTELYIENVVNNSFNITFYDNPLFSDIVAKTKFFINETNNLSVYSQNDTAELFLFNVDLTGNQVGDKSYIAITIKYDFDDNTYSINVTGENNLTTSSSRGDGFSANSGNIVKYVGLSISNETQSFLYQENYLYGGFTTSPTFSSTKPNNVTVSGFGRVNIGLFVSDDQHTETEFNFKDETITITQCSLTVDDLSKTPTGVALAPLKKSLMNICNSLDGAFTFTRTDGETFDPSKYGFCFIMFIGFFFITGLLSAGFSIWLYLLKPALVFPGFLFIWQIFNIFGGLILDYSLNLKLMIGIVFAISGMIALRQLFLTGDTTTGA